MHGKTDQKDARTAWLGIRLSQAEHQAIMARARAAGMGMSEYVRARCTSDRKGPAVIVDSGALREANRELRYIGNNLNQLTKEAHLNGTIGLEQVLKATLNEVASAAEDVCSLIADARASV